ncbi:MAG: flagellar basal body P-ring formation chaperone FlgA [Pseudohongiella sp.]|nr:flagellar basal body P-ring formation chaperone FlgA [Pseudohongiella sp.]MDO9521653.1 flagellar basal body P-ring formation chaperone FlgA [Pseudohongiella sp.]MDP2127880.1 flagellar basal body P-ring formation chaperone FlgA [Pseudohongiella sp.]
MSQVTSIAAQHSPASAYELLANAARDAVVMEFANSTERIEIELPPPDPRLQLPVCASALETSVGRHNGQGGRLNVRVDCRDAAPWARNMAVNVKVYREMLVSSRNLSRGALITDADISIEEVDISQVRGQLIDDPQAAIGMEVRRNVSAGTALSGDMLNAPIMVRRGDTVMLTAERGGISIRQQGTAMQDGESGRQITVRNTSSNRVVQAVVTGHGEARVMF